MEEWKNDKTIKYAIPVHREEGKGPVSHREQSSDSKKRGRKQKKTVLYLIIFFSCLFLIVCILFFAPISIGEVRIQGNEEVSGSDVFFEGRIGEVANVFQISTSDLQKRLEKDPRVQEVKVRRELPLTIVIDIKERQTVATVETEFGYADIDESGRVLKMYTSKKRTKGPLITGKKFHNVLLYDSLWEEDMARALDFISVLSENVRDTFSEINIGNEENLIAYTNDGISVHLGKGENLREQAVLAQNMVRDVRERGMAVEYLVADLTTPFIKLKK